MKCSGPGASECLECPDKATTHRVKDGNKCVCEFGYEPTSGFETCCRIGCKCENAD